MLPPGKVTEVSEPANLDRVAIMMTQIVAECLTGLFRTILLPVAGALTVVAMILAPDSGAARDAILNAFTITAAWIVAEGAMLGSALALRWLDARRNAI